MEKYGDFIKAKKLLQVDSRELCFKNHVKEQMVTIVTGNVRFIVIFECIKPN